MRHDWLPGDSDIKGLWALGTHVTYLNHGAFGATPWCVMRAQDALRREMELEPIDFLYRNYIAKLNGVRAKLAKHLGASAERLAFVPNATTGVASVLASFPLRPGDEIVFSNHGYPWVRQALKARCEATGARCIDAHITLPLEDPAQITQAFAKVLSPRTKLIVACHVTSPTGLIFPVKDIVALGHNSGIPVCIDGAHAPGMLPLQLDVLNADFYVGNLHKWICAPKGAAFLYVKPGWQDCVRPLSPAYQLGEGYHLGTGFQASFDWTGTSDPTAWFAVERALEFFEELGWERVRATNHALVQAGRELLACELGASLPYPDDPRFYGSLAIVPVPLKIEPTLKNLTSLSARMRNLHAIEVPFTVQDEQFYVRISGQIYNSLVDYEVLASALKKELK